MDYKKTKTERIMNILIIEDEAAAARRLANMIKDVEPGAEIVDTLDSIEASVSWFKKNDPPDLALMDIHLADGSSFRIFELVEVTCPVIFATAYDQYAIKAFKVNSIDYLLKPIKKQELQNAIGKFKTLKANKRRYELDYKKLAQELKQNGAEYQKRFIIKIGQNLKAIEPENLAYAYTEEKVTFFCTTDNHRYPVDYSLDKLEELLDTKIFFRINRQFIINIKSIDAMYQYSKGRVKLTLIPPANQDTVVSVERSPHFKEWLEGE